MRIITLREPISPFAMARAFQQLQDSRGLVLLVRENEDGSPLNCMYVSAGRVREVAA